MVNKKVLVIVAHPDDETSCMGTLLKLKKNKAKLFELILTDAGEGMDKRGGLKSYKETARQRQKEMTVVSRALGMEKIFFFGEEDLNLVYSKKLMLKLVEVIRKVTPDLVILMNKQDYHPDHKAAYKLGIAAVRWAASGIQPQLGKPHRVSTVLQMGGMIITKPDFIMDVTDQVNDKVRLLKLHGSQASSKVIDFEMASMTYHGYHMRTSGKYGEPFEFCSEFPSEGVLD